MSNQRIRNNRGFATFSQVAGILAILLLAKAAAVWLDDYSRRVWGGGSVEKSDTIQTTVIADDTKTPIKIKEFWDGDGYGPRIEIARPKQEAEGVLLTVEAAEVLAKNLEMWVSKEKWQEKGLSQCGQSGEHD